MPEETAAALLPDGFLRTGDAGYMRQDGYLRFTGRYKDMLKVGGENGAPAEVEALLLEMPGVQDASVVAYPDERLNEVAAAFLIVARDAVAPRCGGGASPLLRPRGRFQDYRVTSSSWTSSR